jgi:putative N6-adenine-specific DNA methylase
MPSVNLLATCTFGLESVVADELRALGYDDLRVERGRVGFTAPDSAICRANMWLRCADRVLLVMGEFTARTFDELFDQTTVLPWEEWLPEDALFPVEGKSVQSQLSSVPACQSITKKAIVEAMTRAYGRSRFEESGQRYRIQVALLRDKVTLTLDTSGEGLHRRGYRDQSAPAPLRETLAAAMVRLSHWQPEYILADPCCGSGTIPIEAAMMGRNIAPGTLRSFDAFRWDTLPRKLWSDALEEADDLAQPARRLRIWGADISAEAIELSAHHAVRAGVGDALELTARPLAEFKTHHKYGYLIANPPYGERLGSQREAEALYREMGDVFRGLREWSWAVLTPHEGFEALARFEATHRRKLYNGAMRCWLYQHFGPRPPGGSRTGERADD